MENVILIIHLILALCLIGIVLLQRSEGGGLGMGSSGGGAGGGLTTGRAAASAMSKLTWILAVAFIGTSIALTVVAARNSADTSIVDRLGDAPAVADEPTSSDDLLGGGSLLAPTAAETADEPLAPARAE